MILNGLPWKQTNRDRSVVFEFASEYCFLNSFVDHDGYSISSKGEEIPHVQGKRNPSKTVGVARGHQREDTLKP